MKQAALNAIKPPEVKQVVTGHWTTQALYVAAKLRIADLLAEGRRTPADLAQAAGADAPSLYRLLRALASEAIFAAQTGRRDRLLFGGRPT
jgi:Dimerisation domain